MTTIRVHPFFDPSYYGFYWEGFRRLGHELRITTEGFPDAEPGDFYDFKDSFLLQVDTARGVRRLAISADDKEVVRPKVLEWADRLGKVNLPPPSSADDSRVVPIGPSFGVQAWGWNEVWQQLARSRLRTPRVLRPHRDDRSYLRQARKRVPEGSYVIGQSDRDYIFFTAWPWTRHPEVNPPRADFIRSCQRQPGLRFEGGFAPRRRDNPLEFEGLFAPSRYTLREYLSKIGCSALAFNNPAVHGCLGWKLGEFLALGKAIVTLPLGRRLPAELEHGVHFHVVDGSAASIDEAVAKIRSDDSYRLSLEAGARQYYIDWLRPEVVAARLVRDWID